MTEHPILFSAPMVRALLAGTKTQTRRVVKPQPDYICQDGTPARSTDTAKVRRGQMMTIPCPYGQPGDRLWVRETWTTHACFDDIRPSDLTTRSLHYQADGVIKTGKLRPSIHMPRWASRITLEVTTVRVERLQDISEADAIAEGIVREIRDPGLGDGGRPGWRWADNQYAGSPVHGYELLWESINGPSSWGANPFVWVIEFRKISNAS